MEQIEELIIRWRLPHARPFTHTSMTFVRIESSLWPGERLLHPARSSNPGARGIWARSSRCSSPRALTAAARRSCCGRTAARPTGALPCASAERVPALQPAAHTAAQRRRRARHRRAEARGCGRPARAGLALAQKGLSRTAHAGPSQFGQAGPPLTPRDGRRQPWGNPGRSARKSRAEARGKMSG